VLGREALAVARQARLIANARARPVGPWRGERLVVFLHGWFAAGPVFDPMRAYIEERVDVGTVDLTYGPFERFDAVAERLAETIERRAEGRRVDLVGHSLGGIVMRWYLQELGGAERVDRLVTLASPHAGTRVARLGFGPLVEAVRPGSPILERLRERRWRAARVAHTLVVAGSDHLVTPPESGAAVEGAIVHWIDDLGHNEMLFDLRVFEIVASALRH
jgi:pimeloyl-ACP methyl ester carboxylesterase